MKVFAICLVVFALLDCFILCALVRNNYGVDEDAWNIIHRYRKERGESSEVT